MGNEDWAVQLYQGNLNLAAGKKYQVSVELSSTASRSVIIALQNFVNNNATNYGSETPVLPANERRTITFTTNTLKSNTSTGKLYIGLGKVSGSDVASKITVYSVNVVPEEGEIVEDKPYNKLVWSDEFEGNALNTDNWVCEIGNGDNGWGNGEWQYYTDRADNITVRDSVLTITARREDYQGFKYTSARLKTQGKQSFQYGKMEARIKMDKGQGTWPAFWMLGDSISTEGWPKCGEIDIMEFANDWTHTLGTLH